jgi:amino acid permease
MGLFLIVIILIFLYFGINKIDASNLQTIEFKDIFGPYGVILYSLAGIAAIPEMISVFKRGKRHYKKAIILGTIIPAVLYLVFITVVIGLTGRNTSMEAISGLSGVLGNKVVLWGSIFGFLATITSFFVLGLSLKESYIHDFGFNKNWAWFITCFVPIILFALGVQNFILVITLLGAVMGLVECASIILIHGMITGEKQRLLHYFLIGVFILGFIYTIINII